MKTYNIGFNEIILNNRTSGTQQREMNIMPALLPLVKAQKHIPHIYLSKQLDSHLIDQLAGSKEFKGFFKQTHIPTVPSYRRLLQEIGFWKRCVARDNLDVLYTSYYPIPRLRIPVVLMVNDVRWLHLPKTYSNARLTFLKTVVRESIQRAHRIATISADTANDIIEMFGVDERRIDVVHIPIGSQFYPVEDTILLAQAKSKYDIPSTPFILCVGHLEPRKNLIRLIQAYMKLRLNNRIEANLVILGRENFNGKEVFEVAQQGINLGYIHFTGYVEDKHLASIYSMAEMLAFPSLHEGFGIPVLEAMACGIPVLTSNVSALPEVAGDAALLVNPYEIMEIANGIFTILNDKSLQNNMIHRGFERVAQFSAKESAAKLLATIIKAIEVP